MTAKENTNAKNDNVDEKSNPLAIDRDRIVISNYVDQYCSKAPNTEYDSVDSQILSKTDLTNTTVSEILDDFRYLVVIKHLAEFEDAETLADGISMGSLVERVAATENGITRQELTAAHRQPVWISLCETHLPLLDQADIVDWESKCHCIRPRQSVRTLSILLDVEHVDADENTESS